MLTKNHRFRGPRATNHVLKKGRSARHEALSARVAPAQLGATRIAVVVSKKVDKRAVVRNRIRRRVFESVRLAWPNLQHPFDMTIGVFDKKVATMPRKELDVMLAHLLEKAGLFVKK